MAQSTTLKEAVSKLFTQLRLTIAIRLMDLAGNIAPKGYKKPIYDAIVHACNGVIDGTNDIDREVNRLWNNPISSLEGFLAFYYNLKIDDHPNGPGRQITPEQFALIVALFEEHRSDLEKWLEVYEFKAWEGDRAFFDDFHCAEPMFPDAKVLQACEMITDYLIQNLYA